MSFHQSGRAHQILAELAATIEAGYEQRALQRSPHLTLLNTEWYHEQLRPLLLRWGVLWLEANHVSGLNSELVAAYLACDGTSLVGVSWDAEVEAAAAAEERAAPPSALGEAARALRRLHCLARLKLSGKAIQLLNLVSEWLRVYLPHCLQKIDRVSFGLLSTAEYKRLVKTEPHMPRSRLKLAIPFVGKDVPSRASEFAHPDIIIGLTVLAYRCMPRPRTPMIR